MKAFTQRDVIAGVPARWKSQYPGPYSNDYVSIRHKDIYQKIQALNLSTCSAQDIDEIIGNDSWTRMTCDECNQKVDWLLEVGTPSDFEDEGGRSANLCRNCVAMAAEVAKL